MAASDEARLLVRVEATQAKMEKQMAAIAKNAARQAQASEDSFKTANDNIASSFQRGSKAATSSMRQPSSAVANLSFQLNDIAMGLASGTSPFTIMVQQGSHVSQVLQGSGGLTGAIKTLGGAFATMVNPVSLASFALIGLGGAAVQYLMSLKKDVPDTNELLKQHAEIIKGFDEVYGIAEKGAKKYSDAVKTVELQKLTDQYGNLAEAIKAAATALAGDVLATPESDFDGATKSISDMNRALLLLEKDKPDFAAFAAAMTEIENSQAPTSVKELAKGFRLSAQESIPLQQAVEDVDNKLKNVRLSGEDAKKIFENITAAALGLGQGGTDAIGSIVDKITKDLIPALATAATKTSEYFNNFLDLQRQVNQVPLGQLSPLTSGGGQFLNPEQQQRFSANQGELEAAGASAAAQMIKGFEGFITNAKWDVNAFRVGFGSDTTTRANGQIEKVTKDTVVTLDDAQRDLSRRIIEFQSGIQKAIGIDTWKSLNEAQQAALTSIAYNYGSLPKSIVAAIEGGGGPQAVAQAIASLTSNPGRRKEEAQSFLSGTGISLKEAGIGAGSRKKTPEQIFQGDIADVQKRIDVLNAEYEAQSKLNPLIDDYGYAVEKARIQAQLLAEAQKAGLEITPELSSKIGALAENYAKATVSSGQLAEQNQKTVETMQESSAFGKDLLGGFISDLQAGKSASEAFANALSKMADKLLEVSLNALFDGNKSGSGGGLLGGLFGSVGKIFGFDEGGYTGQGPKNKPAGVVHKGEYVFDKRTTDRIGVGNLARLQKGYANGGYVGGVTPTISAPSLPQNRGQSEGIAGIKVYVDENGNWQAKVMGIARQEAAGVTRTGLSQYDKQLDRSFGSRMSRAQGRQL